MSNTAGTRAYEQIYGMILEGELAPGERLKEEELTAICGTSRTPVREALRRLSAEGLVRKDPRRGAQVAEIDVTELEDTYVLRALIECHAVVRATDRISDLQIDRLKELADEMEAAVGRGKEAMRIVLPRSNKEFHTILLQAAASPALMTVATTLAVWLPLVRRTVENATPEEQMRSLRQHRELIAALEARDPIWASAVLQAHIRNAYSVLARPAPVSKADERPRRPRPRGVALTRARSRMKNTRST